MKNASFLVKLLLPVCFLSSFLYAAEEATESTLTAPSLPVETLQIDELSKEERSWFDRLNAEKITPLNGKPWEKPHTEIIFYRSLYETLHLLQEQPTGFQSTLERSLNEAFHPDLALKYRVLGLFYQMTNRDSEAFEAFHDACKSELGLNRRTSEGRIEYEELILFAESGEKAAQYQDKVVNALYKGELGQGQKPEEEWYQMLVSFAERGWESAQRQVVNALYKGELGQGQKPEEERYQMLVSFVERGWNEAKGKVLDALYWRKLGWDKRPEKERYQMLVSLAERGWIDAQKKVVEAHNNNRLGGGYTGCLIGTEWYPDRGKYRDTIDPDYFRKGVFNEVCQFC